MIQIRVRGFRGIDRADIEIAPVCLIVGRNGAGKSSLLQSVAAAITGSPIPFYAPGRTDKPALTKTAAKGLLRGGMDKGYVEIVVGGKAVARVDYPSFAVKGDGSVQSSLVVAGLVNPMDMPEVDRQRFFAGLLRSEPGDDDVRACLKDVGAPVQFVSDLLTELKVQGWDALHARYKTDGAKFKGQWEQATGTAFGKLKADTWRPEGWTEALADRTLEGIGTECTAAQSLLEIAISAQAFEAGELSALETQAKAEASAEKQFEDAKDARDAARAQLDVARAARDAIRVPTAIPCPHCGATVDVLAADGKGAQSGTVLVKSSHSMADIHLIRTRYTTANDAYLALQRGFEVKERDVATVQGQHASVAGSRAKLAAAQSKTGSADAVANARTALAEREAQKKMIEAVQLATEKAQRIAGNQIIVDMLAPDGLRRQKLTKALEDFNRAVLAPIAASAEYQPVTVSAELDVLYGGRPYYLLSESEKYRVRVVLQVAIATRDDSKLVILDGADILDPEGRNGLMALLGTYANATLGFLVAMTMPKKESVPDLAKFSLGASMWVKNGIAEAL